MLPAPQSSDNTHFTWFKHPLRKCFLRLCGKSMPILRSYPAHPCRHCLMSSITNMILNPRLVLGHVDGAEGSKAQFLHAVPARIPELEVPKKHPKKSPPDG